MNPTTNARVRARNIANYRLQALTIGAAVLGVAGTGAFSYAAAMTYTGKSAVTTVDQGNGVDPNSGQTATGQDGSGQFGNGQTGQSGQVDQNGQANPNAQAPSTNQGAAATPKPRHSKHATVSTGGS